MTFLRYCTPLTAIVATALSAQVPPIEPARATAPAPRSMPAAVPPGNMIAPVAIDWPIAQARALLETIDAADKEGLTPASYARAELASAIEGGAGEALNGVASGAALALARDYLNGRVTNRMAFDWKIERSAYDSYALPARLVEGVAAGRTEAWLKSLLPKDERYAALRKALAAAKDGPTRDLIAANMERWRWLPRDLGSDHLFVNVPAYRLQLVADGAVVSRHDVVVGAPATPTPMLALNANALVANPWWNVPQSIVASANLRPGAAAAKRGYVFRTADDGTLVVRQRPGRGNSLGRLKIDMPNPDAIFLHDTNAPAAFAKANRALSHGCIRVKNVAALAGAMLAKAGGDPASLTAALARGETRTLALPRTMPVWLVYFTAEVDDAGKLVKHGDPYKRDAQVVAAIGGSDMALAAR